MALYLGKDKVELNLDGVLYYLNLYANTLVINGTFLLSLDNFILKDSNEIYLIAKGDE